MFELVVIDGDYVAKACLHGRYTNDTFLTFKSTIDIRLATDNVKLHVDGKAITLCICDMPFHVRFKDIRSRWILGTESKSIQEFVFYK